MSLLIRRLDSHFRSHVPLPAGQAERWLATFSAVDGDALGAELAGPDEWLLIRHLPLSLRWRHDASEAEVSAQWDAALREALHQARAEPDGNTVVRYASRRDAIADLLYRSALGETSRQWAWQQMGLIARSGLAPEDVLHHGAGLLCVEPALAWPVLHRLIEAEPATAALTALLRRLPLSDWHALLLASPQSAGYARLLTSPSPTDPRSAPLSATQRTALLQEAGAAVHQLLAWARARPHLAARQRPVLGVLIAALGWPACASPGHLLHARLLAVNASLGSPIGEIEPPPATTSPPAPAIAADARPHPQPPRADDLPPLPALPEAVEWQPTRWAGALFWLGRIPASGILDTVVDGGQRVSQPHLLRALAEALGLPADDAALRAFCGGEPPTDEIPADLRAHAGRLVAGWSAWLDEVATDLPPPRLHGVCQRSGRLRFEAGWIELHLPLDGVSTAIRRLGLDLDPGWLPWLGCVVRICYDE